MNIFKSSSIVRCWMPCFMLVLLIFFGLIGNNNSHQQQQQLPLIIIKTIEKKNKNKNKSCPFETITSKPIQIGNREKLNLNFKSPLYLYSFGGSGNSWIRVLLEYITNIQTGSMIRDHQLAKSLFSSEGICDVRLLVCKAHPRWFYLPEIPDSKSIRLKGTWMQNQDIKMDGIICILRNPWHAMWSLYQLIFNDYKSHSLKIEKDKFETQSLFQFLYLGSGELSLIEMWKRQFIIIDLLFNATYTGWNNDFTRIIYIKYENLLDKKKRMKEILKIIHFLYDKHKYFAIETMKEGIKYLNKEKLIQKIKCAFDYAQQNKKSAKVFKREHNKIENNRFISMNDAYLSLGQDKLCKMWHSLKESAMRFGYEQIFKDRFSCINMDSFKSIKDIDNINEPNMTRYHLYKENQQVRLMVRKRINWRQRRSKTNNF